MTGGGASDSPEREEGVAYFVEAFCGHIKDKRHRFKLVTKWVGWDDKHNTEEPIKEMAADCPDLVLEYLLKNKESAEDIV